MVDKAQEKSEEVLQNEANHAINSKFEEKDYKELGKVHIFHPTLSEQVKADEIYSKNYNSLLMQENTVTSARLLEILEEKGEWTKEHDKKISSLSRTLSNCWTAIEELKHNMNSRNKRVTEKKIEGQQKLLIEAQTEFITLSARKESMLETSIERQSEQKKVMYLIHCCVKREDGSRVWVTYEDLLNEKSREVQLLGSDCVVFWRGAADFLSEQALDHLKIKSDIEPA